MVTNFLNPGRHGLTAKKWRQRSFDSRSPVPFESREKLLNYKVKMVVTFSKFYDDVLVEFYYWSGTVHEAQSLVNHARTRSVVHDVRANYVRLFLMEYDEYLLM